MYLISYLVPNTFQVCNYLTGFHAVNFVKFQLEELLYPTE